MTITGKIIEVIGRLASAALDPEKVWDVELSEHREKRSRTANSYYWQLVGKYADWAGKSTIHIHNDMIEHYGQPMLADADHVVTVVLSERIDYKELTYLHLKWTNHSPARGYRKYVVMRGSSDYDTREFSRLVDGLIQTIQGSGAPIETMTPAELERLKGYIR